MNEAEVWSALARGGAAEERTPVDGAARLGKYNGLLDPAGAARLGDALAERLVGCGATLVVVWEDVEDAVLGFVVARRLDLPVLRTFNADGLVGHAGPLPAGAKAILVTDVFRDSLVPRAVRALLERSGGALLGVAALVDASGADGPLLASLVTHRDPDEVDATREGLSHGTR